jgi:hypothetical protein
MPSAEVFQVSHSGAPVQLFEYLVQPKLQVVRKVFKQGKAPENSSLKNSKTWRFYVTKVIRFYPDGDFELRRYLFAKNA